MTSARPVLRRASNAGRVPVWIPAGLLVAALVWTMSGITEGVSASGVERIDPRSSRLDTHASYADERWNDLLRVQLARLQPVSPHDREGVERIAAVVASMPFVAAVGEPRVLWPDGVDVPLRLRRPVACVRQGAEFLHVAEDGVILPGRWPSPTWVELAPGRQGFLPVIGPNDGAFDLARPGERLKEPRHVDALSVALSLRNGLDADDSKLLGPVLIDATNARRASVDVPGVVIQLERRRTVWFGRAPNAGAIGERPVERKLADLHKAALLLRGLDASPPPAEARDWSLLDVRWDTSDVVWREPVADDAVGNDALKNDAAQKNAAGKDAGRDPGSPDHAHPSLPRAHSSADPKVDPKKKD
jgi:hypothetical protein